MVYLHGDIHGSVRKILEWMDSLDNTVYGKEKVYLIMLGDVGLNLYLDEKDLEKKTQLQEKIEQLRIQGIDVCMLCVRGNHECRPANITTYIKKQTEIGIVYCENQFPDIWFLMDGEIYNIEQKDYLVLGGGNSADYFSRILNQEPFWSDEGYTLVEQNDIKKNLIEKVKEKVTVLAHVLPKGKSVGIHNKTAGLDVEEFAEDIFDIFQEKITDWYCGHYHIDTEFENKGIRYHILYKKMKSIV